MGRHQKRVSSASGIERRASGYYSTPPFVAEYLAKRLIELNPHGSTALDPCIGAGEMALPLIRRSVAVDGYDLIDFDLPSCVGFRKVDFLLDYEKRLNAPQRSLPLPHDFLVANPPYNCHELGYIRQHKARFSGMFGDTGCHNMYSMFISAMIDCAKEDAILGIVTLDSFLTSRVHEPLRRKILDHCILHDLILCPTDLFRDQNADVRTCIVILQKGRSRQGPVRVLNRPADRESLECALAGPLQLLELDAIVLDGDCDRLEWTVGLPPAIRELFALPRLSERFRCVTGISTGNDKRFLSKSSKRGFTIPFYKNPGSKKFFAAPDCFLTDDFLSHAESIPNFMVRNRDVLFRPGITCSSMGVPFSACYRPRGAAFGVNANLIMEDHDTWWMLAYLNSSLVTYLVRGVMLRTNMITSGYVSRLPVPEFSHRAKEELSAIAREAFDATPDRSGVEAFIRRCDKIIAAELAFSPAVSLHLKSFKQNLVKST